MVIGVAWGTLSLFVLPFLVINDMGPIDAIKSSISLCKKTYGRVLIGTGLFGIIYGLCLLAGIGIFLLLVHFHELSLITFAIFLCYMFSLRTVFSVFFMGFRTALFQYATASTLPDNFPQEPFNKRDESGHSQ